MLEQYFGMKAKHPEAILLSRVGDFYEAYGEDAETIARALQIALTSKEAGAGKRVAMAGVPHHALSGYLARLVAQRFIVALAEQLEVPQPNRLVRRDVLRLITPGTLVEEQLLDGKQNNYLAAIAAVGETFALAYVDLSTSYSAATAIAGEDAYDELLAELARVGPVEIVADVAADLRATMATELEAIGARLATPSLGVVDARSRKTFVGFSIDESLAIHRALEALDAFVKRTGVTNGASGPAEPELYRRRQFLALDPATLDVCATSMGSRMLARWILAPLVDREAIAGRQDAVEAMLSEHSRREAIREILKAAFDVERIAQKVRFRRATPRDLASLRRTLLVFRPLRQAVPRALAHLLDRIGDFGEMLDDLQRTLVEEPPAQVGGGGAIRPEANADLAECVALRSDARSKLLDLEQRERDRTGIKALKVKYASPFGYAIEVSKSYTGSVPPEYLRKQTLSSGERYV